MSTTLEPQPSTVAGPVANHRACVAGLDRKTTEEARCNIQAKSAMQVRSVPSRVVANRTGQLDSAFTAFLNSLEGIREPARVRASMSEPLWRLYVSEPVRPHV